MPQPKDTPFQNSFADIEFKLVDILSSLPMGVFLVNEYENVVYTNPAAQKLFNKTVSHPDGIPESSTPKDYGCCEFLSCTGRFESLDGCGDASKCASCSLLKSIRSMIAEKTTEISIGTIELNTEKVKSTSCSPCRISPNERRRSMRFCS